jgi:hypothetical protein
MNDMRPRLMTVQEFALAARISKTHAYKLIRQEVVPPHFIIRYGRSIRVRPEALEGLSA